jgi:hypothetical protein
LRLPNSARAASLRPSAVPARRTIASRSSGTRPTSRGRCRSCCAPSLHASGVSAFDPLRTFRAAIGSLRTSHTRTVALKEKAALPSLERKAVRRPLGARPSVETTKGRSDQRGLRPPTPDCPIQR